MKNKTKNSIIILSIVAVLALVFVVYLKISQNKDIAYIIETKKNNFLNSEKIHAISGLKNKSIEVEQVRKGFDDYYIERNNLLNFIEIIENLAKDKNVNLVIDNVNVDETHLKDTVPYGILSMTMSVDAKNLSSATDFLKGLEKLPYSIDFINIKLINTTEEQKLNVSSTRLSVTINGITN